MVHDAATFLIAAPLALADTGLGKDIEAQPRESLAFESKEGRSA